MTALKIVYDQALREQVFEIFYFIFKKSLVINMSEVGKHIRSNSHTVIFELSLLFVDKFPGFFRGKPRQLCF